MEDRSGLTTEHRNQQSTRIDRMSIDQMFDLIHREDAKITNAIVAAREDIILAIDLIAKAFASGGRLRYVGAGTSGRLGILDAAECPPTFLSDPSQVVGIIAGGQKALTRSIEGAEDHPQDGANSMDQHHVNTKDVVFAIATGGTTPYVHGALHRAKTLGAKTVFFACVPADQVADDADVSIRVITGPEVLTGSTRMKAGTATKMVLNMVTTIAMIQSGKIYQNLMVDVNTKSNAKLVDRGIRIIHSLTGLSRDASHTLLEQADGKVKTALVMNEKNVTKQKAEILLNEANGHVGQILDE